MTVKTTLDQRIKALQGKKERQEKTAELQKQIRDAKSKLAALRGKSAKPKS